MSEEKAPSYFIKFEEIINKKFDNIENKFDNIDKKFDSIDNKFNNLESRFDNLESKFDNIEGKIDGIVTQQEIHFETLGEIKLQLTGIEKKLNTKADESVVENIEMRTSKLESAVFA